MDSELVKTLNELRQRITRMKQRLQRLEQENLTLRESVFEYLQKIESLQKAQQEVSEQQVRLEIMKAGNMDKKKLQKELDRYIHWVDKCLAALETKQD